MSTTLCSLGLLLGRICLSAIFILAGIGKFMDYDGTVQYMASKGFTMIPVFLVMAAMVEIIGGLLILLGFRTHWGAAMLLLFLIPTTVIFHDFWNYQGAEQQMQMINFLKNLGIFGGLLYVLCIGAGKCSLDVCCCKTKP